MNDLSQLGFEHGTDKTVRAHHYTGAYNGLMEVFRQEELEVVEIGVYGGASLRMWRDYFPKAQVWGVDNGRDARIEEIKAATGQKAGGVPLPEEERIRLVFGDGTSEETLAQLPEEIDMVVDDGSHVPNDYIRTLELLFPRTKRLYVIEDVAPNHWEATKWAVERISKGAYVQIRSDYSLSVAVALFTGGE